jgi:hypothetical protein
MNPDCVAVRLASLPEHDRYLAQAQIARAEAMVDALSALARLFSRAWQAARAALARRAKAYTDERTRYWPHAQA